MSCGCMGVEIDALVVRMAAAVGVGIEKLVVGRPTWAHLPLVVGEPTSAHPRLPKVLLLKVFWLLQCD